MIFIVLVFSDRTQLVSVRRTQLVSAWAGASEHQAKLRQKEIQEIDKKASKEHEEAKKNSNFTQTYPKGWQRIRELVRDKNRVLPL